MEELNLKPLKNALQQLESGLNEAQINPSDDLRRDGVILRFEYSMDLAWKLIQRYLKTITQIDEATIRTKKDIFREAAKIRLITNAEAWIGHYEARNETSHVYNLEVAKAVFERAAMFLPDATDLIKALQHGS